MTANIRPLLMLAVLSGWAMSAAAQSANRTGPPTALPVSRSATVMAPETARVTNCRVHCGSLAATAPHVFLSHQSVAEWQARAAACLRNMSK
jgi:hypothetical protein